MQIAIIVTVVLINIIVHSCAYIVHIVQLYIIVRCNLNAIYNKQLYTYAVYLCIVYSYTKTKTAIAYKMSVKLNAIKMPKVATIK